MDNDSAENSPLPLILKGVTLLVVIAAFWSAFNLRRQAEAVPIVSVLTPTEQVVALVTAIATNTPILTDTATPRSTATNMLTATPQPTSTPTPIPTPTLQPPYEHQITEGEALYNISLRYAVSVNSIIAINPGLSPERIVSGRTINVPRPTATPPLVPVLVDSGEEKLLADPTDCIMHEIAEADTFFGIARKYNVPLDAILLMNRLSAETLLNPGDTVCIPTIIYNATSLEAGEGDFGGVDISAYPTLLFPADGGEISAEANPITLQWLAQRSLVDDEWYMVEITDLSSENNRPRRAFTQSTSFQIPAIWQSDQSQKGTSISYRWRVSYVQIIDQRDDGEFVYAFSSPRSEAVFTHTP